MKTIIRNPLITEKNTNLAESGIYVFEVGLDASKPEIKQAIETGFSVKVQGVRTVICRNDMKYSKFGLTKPKKWKKAFVKLADGQKLSLFEGA